MRTVPAVDGPLYMDVEITPHRSLSRRGRRVLMGVVIGINLVTALVFLSMGAKLVLPFLGIDVAGMGLALAVNTGGARRRERVRVGAQEVWVTRLARGREELVWTSPTRLTRSEFIDDETGPGLVQLRLRERRLAVAQDLSRPERVAFAKALDLAIWTARREGWARESA